MREVTRAYRTPEARRVVFLNGSLITVIDTRANKRHTSMSGSSNSDMITESRHRMRTRWVPEADPDRKNLETLFAFAYGMQMGQLRRISEELSQLAQQAQTATAAAGAAIAVEHQHRIECIARSGDAAPQLGSRPAANIGLSGECLRTGTPQFCVDTETHPFVDRMHSRSVGLRSIVYVPVFRGDKPEGVVGVFATKPNHFTQQDVRLLQMIACEVTRTLKWEKAPEVTPPVQAPEAASAAEAPVAPPIEEQLEQPAAPIAAASSEGTAVALALEPTLAPAEPAPDAELEKSESQVEPNPVADESQPPTLLHWDLTSDDDLGARPFRRLAIIAATTMVVVAGALWLWYMVPRWTADRALEPTADYIARTQKAAATAPPAPSNNAAPVTSDLSAEKPGVSVAPGLIFLRDVRTQINDGHVFVSVHLSNAVQFQTHQIPDRIYVDLHGVQLSPLLKATKIDPAGPIAQFKLSGTSEPGVVRLTMVLDAPCTYLVSVTSDPHVIILDVQPQKGVRPKISATHK